MLRERRVREEDRASVVAARFWVRLICEARVRVFVEILDEMGVREEARVPIVAVRLTERDSRALDCVCEDDMRAALRLL